MAVFELAAVAALAGACVPTLPHVRGRLIAHAMVESGFDPLAINDNTTKASYRFTEEAGGQRPTSQSLPPPCGMPKISTAPRIRTPLPKPGSGSEIIRQWRGGQERAASLH